MSLRHTFFLCLSALRCGFSNTAAYSGLRFLLDCIPPCCFTHLGFSSCSEQRKSHGTIVEVGRGSCTAAMRHGGENVLVLCQAEIKTSQAGGVLCPLLWACCLGWASWSLEGENEQQLLISHCFFVMIPVWTSSSHTKFNRAERKLPVRPFPLEQVARGEL